MRRDSSPESLPALPVGAVLERKSSPRDKWGNGPLAERDDRLDVWRSVDKGSEGPDAVDWRCDEA